MKYRGVAYYPEAWPRERWDTDIAMMREAGINLVRMGEFAWSRFEPEDGRFSLDWWEDICARMHAAGISILACTPSATPPVWLSRRHPDCLPVFENGTRPAHGGRRHYCPSSAEYREFCARVNTRIADAVRDNPAVVAWQIDNEIALESGSYCCCRVCTRHFRKWLQDRYETLEALNEAWGTVFWSGDFPDWDLIAPPYPAHARKSWRLDYARFQSDVFGDFVRQQAETLRGVKPTWPITTNAWAGLNAAIDVRPLFAPCDFAANDGYAEYYASREAYAAVWDFFRNTMQPKRPFWLAETNAWNPCNTREGMLKALRPWAYLVLAKGADALIYFRWRQSRMGEENHPAVLDWSGRPSRAYAQVSEIFNEMQTLGPALQSLPLPKAEAALLFDFGSAHYAQLQKRAYYDHVVETSATLARLHVLSDIVSAGERLDLSPYRLVILPELEMTSDALCRALEAFVENGGVVLAQPRLGTVDTCGKYVTESMPAGLTGLFGVRIRERWNLSRGRHGTGAFREAPDPAPPSVRVRLALGADTEQVAGLDHMELPELAHGARALAAYESGAFAGEPAVAERIAGKGAAIYQACWLDEAGTHAVCRYALARAAIQTAPAPQPDIDVIKRGPLRFYLNHRGEPIALPQLRPGKPLIGSADGTEVRLEAMDVCVIEEGG